MDDQMRALYIIMLKEEIIQIFQDYTPHDSGCIALHIVFKDKYGARRDFLTTLEPIS